MADRPALDRTDRAIIAVLQDDARLSNKELAARVGIAPSTCSERMKRLEHDGVFSGFHAVVDPHVLGIGLQAMIAVRLRRHAADEVDAFHRHAIALPEVISLSHVTGPNDFLVRVVVRDADHLRELAVSGFTTMREVDHIETALIFEHVAKGTLPDLSSRSPASRQSPVPILSPRPQDGGTRRSAATTQGALGA